MTENVAICHLIYWGGKIPLINLASEALQYSSKEIDKGNSTKSFVEYMHTEKERERERDRTLLSLGLCYIICSS